MKRRRSPAKSKQSPQTGQFRIIGGQWRSRKLAFPENSDLRPTPDRVRETVFNWLQDTPHGARVLDLFCGSGAMGLEALSRGAKEAVFIDAAGNATAAVKAHLQTLQATNGTAINGTLPNALTGASDTYHLVFIDPPYAKADLIRDCLDRLLDNQQLAKGAMGYFEC